MRKIVFYFLGFCFAACAMMLTACNGEHQSSGMATFSIVNYMPIDSIIIDGEKQPVDKDPKLRFSYADSLEDVKHYLNTKTPISKTFEIPVKKDGFTGIQLFQGDDVYTAYVTANDSVTFTFNANKMLSNATYNGQANHPALLLAIDTLFTKMPFGGMRDTLNKAKAVNDNNKFLKEVNEKKAFIEKAVSENKISPILGYALQKHIENELMLKDGMASASFVFEDKSLALANARSLPTMLLAQRGVFNTNPDDKGEVEKTVLATIDTMLVDKAFEPGAKKIMLFRLFNILAISAQDKVKPNLNKIADTAVRNQFDKILTRRYMLDIMKYKKDSSQVHIFSNDENRTRVTLQQLLEQNKGKIVYVDLWASWCGYCRLEFPYSHVMMQEFKDKPVTFLYLSIDDNFQDWMTASEEEGMAGYENSRVLVNYNTAKDILALKVFGVPRYLIYDKNGKLIDDNATRPSDPKTKKRLIELMSK